VVFAYLLAVGEAGFAMVGPPLIISALLLVLFIAYSVKPYSNFLNKNKITKPLHPTKQSVSKRKGSL